VSRLRHLIFEIHRRSLWQVLGIYLVGAWIAFQGVEAIVSGLALPDWVPGFAVVLLIVGLPVVLATAFVQEGVGFQEPPVEAPGPPGTRVATARDDAGELRRLFTWRNAILGGVLAFALWGVVAGGWLLTGGELGRAPGPIRSLAVLPLENLSGDPEQEYFADGMTEALISDLAKLSPLSVISRTSVMQYKRARRPLPEIARELQVDAVVEGSVLRAGGDVRITAQLIDGRNDQHLWAESYTRDLDDVLVLQSEVARAIAREIELELTPAQQVRLASTARVEPAAYDAYVKGSHYLRSLTPSDHRIGVKYLEEAVRQDPSYAPAWADLSMGYT
jgi:TolB-like protein